MDKMLNWFGKESWVLRGEYYQPTKGTRGTSNRSELGPMMSPLISVLPMGRSRCTEYS